MRKLTDYAGFIVAGLIMIAAVLTYVAPHFGWRVDAVLSGSMKPELKTGSLVVTQPVRPASIEVGDIITFRQSSVTDDPVTHRVVGITQNSSLNFKTKGDANDRPDPFAVPGDKVIGRICFEMPVLGYIVRFLQTPAGFIIGVVIPGITIIALYIYNLRQAIKAAKKGK